MTQGEKKEAFGKAGLMSGVPEWEAAEEAAQYVR